MNGITLWLLLATTAQISDGKERDFGWQVNADDGVVEYIVQIKPAEVVAMQNRSVAFPNGQEDVSNMPPELVGRVSRIVVRIGEEILPRTPSLQELEQIPRRGASLDATTTAQLGPGRMQDLEAGNVYNIQQNSAPTLPKLPSGLPSSSDPSLPSQSENLIDQVGKAAGPSAFPDSNALAQNFNNQQAASGFLNDARGSKFNSTAPPANTPPLPPANLPLAGGANSSFGTNNPLPANNSNPNKNYGATGNSTAATGLPSFPDPRLNPPSLNPSQAGLPQQQTPAAGFGTSPNFSNRQPATNNGLTNNWNVSPTNAGSNGFSQAMPQYADPSAQHPNYAQPSFSQPGYPANYTSAPLTGSSTFQPTAPLQNSGYDRVALNNNALNNSTGRVAQPINSNANQSGLNGHQNAGNTNLDNIDYLGNPTTVDGVLPVLFVLSLVVNFYLGILIRKLLMRYRSLLMNVRSQTA